MGPRLTLVRVEHCLQQGRGGALRGAVGVSGGIPADLDHAIAEAAVRAA